MFVKQTPPVIKSLDRSHIQQMYITWANLYSSNLNVPLLIPVNHHLYTHARKMYKFAECSCLVKTLVQSLAAPVRLDGKCAQVGFQSLMSY